MTCFFQFTIFGIKRWLRILLEIRENGIVHGVTFWPWGSVKYCRLRRFDDVLLVRVQGRFERDVGITLPPKQKQSALEALSRFVEISGSFYETKSVPTQTNAENRWTEKNGKTRDTPFPFQYDLRTLLLFVVVVASFSSWYGIFSAEPSG